MIKLTCTGIPGVDVPVIYQYYCATSLHAEVYRKCTTNSLTQQQFLFLFHIVWLTEIYGTSKYAANIEQEWIHQSCTTIVLLSFTSMQPLNQEVYKKCTINPNKTAVLLLAVSYFVVDRNRTYMCLGQEWGYSVTYQYYWTNFAWRSKSTRTVQQIMATTQQQLLLFHNIFCSTGIDKASMRCQEGSINNWTTFAWHA
jgi:hypothetical protein